MRKVAIILFSSACFTTSCEEKVSRMRDDNYNPVISPENFVDQVTNPYFPLTPGKVYTYRSITPEGTETTVVTIMNDVKVILGVTCTIVRDVVSLDGAVIEDTFDWYAQDKDGNVWYMGEDVRNYENGKFVDSEGSFETGTGGAKPGSIMLANPVLEMPYRQEYYFNVAEDWAKVVSKNNTVTTVYGTFSNCLKTLDWNPLEPDAPREFKFYAPEVGLIKEEVEGSMEFSELISID